MKCIYIVALLALTNCEPNQTRSFRNRGIHMYLQKKVNVFKQQQNKQITSRDDLHKIFGGEFVMDIEQYPFMALLLREFKMGNNDNTGLCAATVINKKYLLSAAHCFQKPKPMFKRHPANEYTAYVGGLSMDRSLDRAKVKKYFIHPQNEYYKDYGKHINNFDIAVIELNKELHLSSKISSVKLPSPLTKFGLTSKLPKSCILIGVGITSKLFFKSNFKTNLLKETQVEIVNPSKTSFPDCKEITKICNIDVTHNENTFCRGDSGGPLMCDDVQVGIVSYNYGCRPNLTAVNTRVEYFVDWINTIIKGN